MLIPINTFMIEGRWGMFDTLRRIHMKSLLIRRSIVALLSIFFIITAMCLNYQSACYVAAANRESNRTCFRQITKSGQITFIHEDLSTQEMLGMNQGKILFDHDNRFNQMEFYHIIACLLIWELVLCEERSSIRNIYERLRRVFYRWRMIICYIHWKDGQKPVVAQYS